jgi:hydroxymethylpyrimidine pyrophosphatase-like HAD family hydrolase
LTHFDFLPLGQRLARRCPDRSQPILLLGLRTSGSYFAPLLRAFLKAEGYAAVASLTVRPEKGPGRQERDALKRYAVRGYTVAILDDPPHTAGTIFLAFDMCCRAGFGSGNLLALVPTHPATRNWSRSLPGNLVVSLEPEHWHKQRLLDPAAVEVRLAEYFEGQDLVRTCVVVASRRAEEFTARLQDLARDERGVRLKRIYEVQLLTCQGQVETRYVLAKSVGWGWLGYHAFLAGHGLAGFVPPVLGLRDGILFAEWLPQPASVRDGEGTREALVETSASYVAARVRFLGLRRDRVGGKDLQRHQNGLQLLATVLSKAYGGFVTDTLMRPRLQRRLGALPCPVPTLIDANMGRTEWVVGSRGLLKTDYEHHGMGKGELNVIDPAYDLAETILDLALSSDEERQLLRRYAEESGDAGVGQRLFMNKLLAGIWAMHSAQEHLFGRARAVDGQQQFHQRFMDAWNFLTVHTARYCGSHCRPPRELRWQAPLVVLDIDGVLDRRLFGFPCATAAGMEALSLLNAHGFTVALNTARSAVEVKDYCEAYSLAGGVAEHGSYLWDAVGRRGRVLIGPKAMRQLDALRNSLRQIPGVFLDDRHQYSIRAFTYDKARGMLPSLLRSVRSFTVGAGAPSPLPTLVMHHLMTVLGLDQLSFHHTTIDTTIVVKDLDKGTGLSTLRDCVLGPESETIAVGDSEPDLSMFRAATHSFAPAHIGCARQARLLGCRIVGRSYQKGFLDIARSLVHLDGGRCEHCAEGAMAWPRGNGLFMDLLQVADRTRAENLIGALFDPAAYRIFLRY